MGLDRKRSDVDEEPNDRAPSANYAGELSARFAVWKGFRDVCYIGILRSRCLRLLSLATMSISGDYHGGSH